MKLFLILFLLSSFSYAADEKKAPPPLVISAPAAIAQVDTTTGKVTYEKGHSCDDLVPVLLGEIQRLNVAAAAKLPKPEKKK